MGEIGMFAEDARVELLDGEVIEMAPIGSRHAGCVKYLARDSHGGDRGSGHSCYPGPGCPR